MRVRSGAVPASLCLLASCLTPPAVLEANAFPLEKAREFYPSGSEVVELCTEAGDTLRGLFVPAAPDAPVVLHLLDSSGSVAGIGSDLGDVAAQLVDLGFASLVVDYTGVGVSGGERSVDNLLADAGCVWREAVRRAGAPERVIVRALSLGTIAAGGLLESGARPRALVLIAPVFPDTVVPRFAREFHGRLAAFAAGAFFRGIDAPDPAAAVAAAGVPCTLLAPREDSLLSEEEFERLVLAVAASGGRSFHLGGSHLYLAARARRLAGVELSLFSELAGPPASEELARVRGELPAEVSARLAPGSEEGRRFEEVFALARRASALELAAAALANDDAHVSARMLWLQRVGPFPVLDFEDRVAALSLRDPCGDVSIDTVEILACVPDMSWKYSRVRPELSPECLGGIAARKGEPFELVSVLEDGQVVEVALDLRSHWQSRVARGTSPADASRWICRALLKAYRVPDRVSQDADGSWKLEALWKNGWERVAYEPQDASAGASATTTAR